MRILGVRGGVGLPIGRLRLMAEDDEEGEVIGADVAEAPGSGARSLPGGRASADARDRTTRDSSLSGVVADERARRPDLLYQAGPQE